MATSILQIRVDDKLKDDVSDLFESLGMDIPTAVRIFFKRAVIERGLPFKVSEHPTMSEEEIEAEIKATRAERK